MLKIFSLLLTVFHIVLTYYAGKQIRDLLAFCTEEVLQWHPENWTDRVREIQKSSTHHKYTGRSECNASNLFPGKI